MPALPEACHPPYRAPAWLAGPHLQTVWPALFATRPGVRYHRVRWDTPDGDFIDIDLTDADRPGAPGMTRRPFVVLFHGLEGDSGSHYARSLMAAVSRRGWRGAVAHFRGCSGEPNRLPRAYHSGDSDEIDWIMRRFAAGPAREAPLFAAGVSLGGNALLKWLGERGESARFVTAAASVSPPQDLAAGAHALSRGFNRAYTANFLRTLKRKSLAQWNRHPGLFDRDRMLGASDFFEFDDTVTAPMHGFSGARDYWRRASCKAFLRGIEVSSVIIHAINDPFLPASVLARTDEVSPQVRLDYQAQGGHAGFACGAPPGRLDWLPERILAFFESFIGQTPKAREHG